MARDLISRGARHPRKVPRFVYTKVRQIFRPLRYDQLGTRVHFKHESVVNGWGIEGAGLPHFSSRLYKEVKLLNAALGLLHVKRSLEIGCGYARLTPWIAEYSDEHFAIEPENALVDDARKLYPKISFSQASVQELPFPDSFFDLCISWTVLGHIPPQELQKAIYQMKRVCSPNAIIILAEGVGKTKNLSSAYWEYTLEEWQNYLLPWRLIWVTERRIEETFKGTAGLVMRFHRSGA